MVTVTRSLDRFFQWCWQTPVLPESSPWIHREQQQQQNHFAIPGKTGPGKKLRMLLSRGYTLASPEFRDMIPVRPLPLTGDSTQLFRGKKIKKISEQKTTQKTKQKHYNNTGDIEVSNRSGKKKKKKKKNHFNIRRRKKRDKNTHAPR